MTDRALLAGYPRYMSIYMSVVSSRSGPVFCLLLRISSGCARPITGQVTELTPSKRQKMGPGLGSKLNKFLWLTMLWWQMSVKQRAHKIKHNSWAHFVSLAQSKLRLCSANHRPGYWSNLSCDWPSTAWAYSEQETENGPWNLDKNWPSFFITGCEVWTAKWDKTHNYGP